MTPRSRFWPHITSNGPTALGPFFIPKTRYLWLPNTMQPSCMFQIRIQGGQKMTFLAPSWLIFSWFSTREMAGILYLTNHWIFSPRFSCNDVIYRAKSNAILITWFGAAVGQIQHMGAWKVGFMPRPIRHKCPHWLQWNSTAMEPFETKSSCSQWGHAHSGKIWKPPPFWGSDSPLCKKCHMQA